MQIKVDVLDDVAELDMPEIPGHPCMLSLAHLLGLDTLQSFPILALEHVKLLRDCMLAVPTNIKSNIQRGIYLRTVTEHGRSVGRRSSKFLYLHDLFKGTAHVLLHHGRLAQLLAQSAAA